MAESRRGAWRLPQHPGLLTDAAFLQSVLDAIPLATLIVDFDARVLLVNAAGRALVAGGAVQELRRVGEVLGCQRAPHEVGECGHDTACRRCVIRNSVRHALFRGTVQRARGLLELARGGAEAKDLLVSAAGLEYQERKLAVLVLKEIGATS
jgi:hypothetical protein